MNLILTGDWHLTDNPNDEYRWGLFSYLRAQIAELDMGVKILFILGDLTEKKDYHSAKLVNRLVAELVMTYRAGLTGIVILRGNHGGLGEVEFFEFLKWFPYIQVHVKPVIERFGMTKIALLPHTRNPKEDWATIEFSEAHYVFTHVTVSGAKSESDFSLGGDNNAEFLKTLKVGLNTGLPRIYSGDVHVPQKIGELEYVGAPYPIRFGDRFKGRIIVLGNKGRTEWHYPTIKKAKLQISSVEELNKAWLKKGDQLKVELVLPREDRHRWHQFKAEVSVWCDRKGVLLEGAELMGEPTKRLNIAGRSAPVIETHTPETVLREYSRINRLSENKEKTGRRLLRIAQDKQ